jgi:hypothetical protein
MDGAERINSAAEVECIVCYEGGTEREMYTLCSQCRCLICKECLAHLGAHNLTSCPKCRAKLEIRTRWRLDCSRRCNPGKFLTAAFWFVLVALKVGGEFVVPWLFFFSGEREADVTSLKIVWLASALVGHVIAMIMFYALRWNETNAIYAWITTLVIISYEAIALRQGTFRVDTFLQFLASPLYLGPLLMVLVVLVVIILSSLFASIHAALFRVEVSIQPLGLFRALTLRPSTAVAPLRVVQVHPAPEAREGAATAAEAAEAAEAASPQNSRPHTEERMGAPGRSASLSLSVTSGRALARPNQWIWESDEIVI